MRSLAMYLILNGLRHRKLPLFAAISLFALNARAAEVQCFAAASLSDALNAVAADYRKLTGDKILFNFGASSTLARQIEEGAPADIFFSADEAKMDELQKRGLIAEETRKSRLSNALVVVTPADGTTKISSATDLAGPGVKRIALADPKAVPAGIYAKEYLSSLKLWPAVEPKVIPCDNVRAALAAVESGNADAGIVYKTDASISKKVKIAYEVPLKEGPRISYPLALMKDPRRPEAARKFLDYLNSDSAGHILEKFGFIVLE